MKTNYSPTGESWGLLVSLDLFGCDPNVINSGKELEKYVVELCDVINMKRYGPCHCELFGEAGTPLAGYSVFQFIETSCISGHFSASDNSAYVDVFSCSEFDPVVVEEFTTKFFKSESCIKTVTPRMYDPRVRPGNCCSCGSKVKQDA
ncbi:S-adenosylmethionine decarboxylase [Methanocella sp. CWC-04]|uniref:S-adenosylmethionine decarboxylase n=1 Tax=Methanooceanicella nereidis TaxID=2052831 RepID=A0AAP2RBJ6_9EURY|nr:S-adenosylmethionine decarboxylase [Methanocella sp. CWC-04]MCD1294308.1 S-adenosylmethionine decarboxylase [Methanocella sp. CWC-04]